MPVSSSSDPDALPDFAALFAVCTCGRLDCGDCEMWQLTPRAAAALWVAAVVTADDAYDDIAEYGHTAIADADGWSVFDQYPPITYRQDADWRRGAARAYHDLAADLAAGRWPRPRSAAEEMALHLVVERARDWAADPDAGIGIRPQEVAGLPAHRDDLDWQGALDALFADHDILLLFDPGQDGIEDPAGTENEHARIGDYRPAAWFTPFAAEVARDPHRGFRR
jgi:hypothetical protein